MAPTISQAMVAAGWGGSEWVEVCTSQGTRWVTVDETNDGDDGSLCVGVCAYCFTHAGSFGLTPGVAAILAGHDDLLEARVSVVLPSVSSNRHWSSPLTRAPPYLV